MRLLAALFLTAACSTTPAITVVATPNPVPGDGLTKITVTATATEGGSPSSGATVHFKTDLGTFDGATGTGQLIDQMTDDQGRAVVTLAAPRQGWGTINFTASVSLQGKEPTETVAVPLSPGGGAFAASISFTCTSHNIGGLVFNRQSDLHMLCRATVMDASNHIIPHASVQTLTEAGTLEWLDDDNGVQEFVYTVRPDDHPPKDVGPCDSTSTANCKEQAVCPTACRNDPFGSACTGEPCWVDATGVTHNPRDGVATLVAAVPARGFDTSGEPFVDMNDNGVRDDDEPYIDFNGNGKYDAGDGTSRDHLLWKVFRVIWSGGATIPLLGQGNNHSSFMVQDSLDPNTFKVVFVDANLNNLAADGTAASDGLAWGATCHGANADGAFDVPNIALDQNNPGILFVNDTGAISAPGSRTTYTQVSSVNTISGAGGSMSGQTCTVSVQPHRVYDPGAPGFDAQGSDPDNGLAASFTF